MDFRWLGFADPPIRLAAAVESQPGPPTAPQRIAVIPVLPGDMVPLPFDGDMAARLGANGNLAIKSGDLTIILQGYVAANLREPVTLLAGDNETVDVAALLQATGPGAEIQTAIGGALDAPSIRADDDATGNGIFVPFAALGTLPPVDAVGALGDTLPILGEPEVVSRAAPTPELPIALKTIAPPVQNPPTADDLSVAAVEDGSPVAGAFSGDDPDPGDQGKLTFALLSQPAEGSVTDNKDGTFSFDPGADFQGQAEGETRTVTFQYTATDPSGLVSPPATVTVTVTGINDAPIVQDLALTAEEGGLPVDGTFDGDDTDSDDDPASLTYAITSQPGRGTAINNGDGTFTFDPGPDFSKLRSGESATVTFTYAATDQHSATSNTGTVTVVITGTDNTAPIAEDVKLAAVEDGPAVGAAFIGDDADKDDDPTTLSFLITEQPDEGAATNNKDGTFTFDPGGDFQDLAEGETREVTFKYRAVDSHNDVSQPATVTVTVTGINDAPTAGDVAASVDEGKAITAGFLADDLDSDDDPTTLSYLVTAPPSAGSVIVNPDGTFTFDTGDDFDDLLLGQTRIVTFTYTATDSHGAVSASATVTITVQGANVTPIDPDACIPPADQLAKYTYVAGTKNSDVLSPGGNNNLWIQSFAGDDVLVGAALADLIEAGDGNDTIDSGGGNDAVLAGAGNDTIQAGDGDDCVGGGDGDDTVDTGNGNDRLRGEAGNDNLDGSGGEDTIAGGEGNDKLQGNQGQDIISGDAGDDKVGGGDGDDQVDGAAGNDVITGDQGQDKLSGAEGDDEIHGGTGDDIINGGGGNDKLFGDDNNDSINGGGGDDRIEGGDGDDKLNGGGGFDVLVGGPGHDTINGDPGDIIIQYTKIADAGDEIVNFDADPAGGHDTIDLDQLFDSLEDARGGPFGQPRAALLSFSSSNGIIQLFIDDDENPGTAPVLLATIATDNPLVVGQTLIVDSP